MFDEAKSLAVMMKMRGLSQCETAKMLGVSQSYVANKLRLLKLDEETQKRIISEGLSERHARAVLRLDNEELRKNALDKICLRRLTVAEAEALVDMLVMKEAPRTVGRGQMLSVIDSFLDLTKRSLDSVRASGAGVRSKISYDNNKVYISICINENGSF